MHSLLVVTTSPRTLWFLSPFAAHFRRLGWRVDALTGPVDTSYRPEHFDRVHEITWSRRPTDVRNLLVAPARVRAVVRDGAYDIVHVHTPVAAFVSRFALRNRARSSGPRVIYTAHGFHFHPRGSVWKNAAFVGLEKLAARWTDHLVVINHEDAAVARRLRLVAEDRIWRMPGIGVDPAYYSPGRVPDGAVRELRSALGVGRDPCVLMVAEFIPRKRHADAVEAFRRVVSDPGNGRCHLLLAGTGPLRDAMELLAARAGIRDRVQFLGARPDVPVLMRASSALLLPSDQEGLPRAVLEAMCMGLPVIGANIRGTSELLRDGCGFLHEVGDVPALAAALSTVLREPAAATEVARRARVRVAGYEQGVVIKLHEELYAAALGESFPRRAEVGT